MIEKIILMNIIYIFAQKFYRRYKDVLKDKMQITSFLMIFFLSEICILVV